MLDAVNSQPGCLQHHKIIHGRAKDKESGGWMYIGSANLSESAWGKMTIPKKKGSEPYLLLRNYEFGVVLVEEDAIPLTEIIAMDKALPLGDARKPWMMTMW